MAKFLGITASAYSKIENGHSTLSMIMTCKIANFLEIDLVKLVQEEKDVENAKTKSKGNEKETEFYEQGIEFFKETRKMSELLENWLKK